MMCIILNARFAPEPVYHCEHCGGRIEHDQFMGTWLWHHLPTRGHFPKRRCGGKETTALPIFEEVLNPIDRDWLSQLRIKVESHG
jgi:hypothetical protein